MNFLKGKIKKIILKWYDSAKATHNTEIENNRILNNHRQASIGEGTIVSVEASLHNHSNDNSKLKIGKECMINGQLFLFAHGGEIQIGDHVFIGSDTKIWSARKIIVGNRVLIAHNVNIHDNISHPLNSKLRHEDYMFIYKNGSRQKTNIDLRENEIIIGDDVWIGFNSTIMKGVIIGEGAIIGANTVVTNNVPPFAVVIGNPQKIIKYVN